MAKHEGAPISDRNPASIGGRETQPPALAGSLLRAGREAAGLTIDAVAQQLKLAPRQVQALEEGDYTRLPGRTFVRGFMRNYARLVRIDPESVLRALPASNAAPALDTPMLQPTAPTMGELPVAERAKPGFARWVIPLVLAAIVAAAALYEWLRPPADPRTSVARPTANGPEHPAPAPRQEPAATALPNPLASAAEAPGAAAGPAATASPPAVSPPSPSETTASTGGAASAAVGAAPATMASTEPAAASDQPLVLAFRDYSWTEVRDRRGRVLLSGFNSAGTAQTLSGTPPLDLVIGNASEVTVRYKGQPVDLAPYTRQNVARFTLP
jgi:cytoskeleton protein RodZ